MQNARFPPSARVAEVVGPVGPGNLQYAAMWKVAQRLTKKLVEYS